MKIKLSAVELDVLSRIKKQGHAMKLDSITWLLPNVTDSKYRKVKNHVIESLIKKNYLELVEVRGILRVTVRGDI